MCQRVPYAIYFNFAMDIVGKTEGERFAKSQSIRVIAGFETY